MSNRAVATILVVEDEISILDVITDALEGEGFAVHACTCAQAGVDVLRQHPEIDLLFTDIRLPGDMSGWDLAEFARGLRPEIPVVYATGYAEGPRRIVSGAEFFTKPYRIAQILETIVDLLNNRPNDNSKPAETSPPESQDTTCAASPSASYSVPV